LIEFAFTLRLAQHIKDLLRFLLNIARPKRQASRIAILDESNKEISMANIPANKKRVLTARAVLENGGPAKFQAGSVPEWSVEPQGGILLFPAADGLNCDAAWNTAGMQTITCKGLNEAGREILGAVDIFTDVADVPPTPMAARIMIDIGPIEDL
jgi:hypothetical protein